MKTGMRENVVPADGMSAKRVDVPEAERKLIFPRARKENTCARQLITALI